MFLGRLLPSQVDEVKAEAENHFTNWPPKYKSALWEYLKTVFLLWKIEHGDRSPKSGLLLGTPVEFETAEPYQCAGIGISNNIDLAFKLWAEKYPPFMKVIDTVTTPKVFAMLLLHETNETVDFKSITNVRDLLHDYEKLTLKFEKEKLQAILDLSTPHIARGTKILGGARKGHEVVHGSAEEKSRRYAEYQRAVNELVHANSALSWDAICKKAGERFGVSKKTILRHTTRPNK